MPNVFGMFPLQAKYFDSGAATDGDVLTADGAGNSAWETPAPGGGGLTDITYADLVTTIGAAGLTPGGLYRITDYATKHYIVDANGNQYTEKVAQVDTVTLTGTAGTADISAAGALTKTATFTSDLSTTAANFVSVHAAAYLTAGIVLTSSVADLIFTANVAGTPFVRPVITNTSDSLDGTVAHTTGNDDPIIIGTTEPLIVMATGVDTISSEAKSALHPEDVLHYDWNPVNWIDDLSFATDNDPVTGVIIPDFRGVITFRHDTLLDNYAGFDWRECKFRRWKTNATAWDEDAGYNKAAYVNYSDAVYKALVAIGGIEAQISTITLTGSDGTANVGAAGGLTKLVTFASDLPTTAANFVSAWAADYLPGIVVTANGANLVFTAAAPGVGFTEPTISNVSGSLAGTVVLTNANVPPNTDPASDAVTWVKMLDLADVQYWNVKSGSWHGIPSADQEFADFTLYAEGEGTAVYEKCCRANHWQAFKDDTYDWDIIGTLLPNNVVFLADDDYFGMLSNEIAAESCGNTIYASYFAQNTIGKYFGNNTIGASFNGNTIGTTFYLNTIGASFGNNTISAGFSSNTIGTSFGNNTIGANFSFNTIGANFSSNTIGTSFSSNTIGTSFQMNDVADKALASTDLTSATHVYLAYNCWLFHNATPAPRLRYYDGSDVLVVVAPTA